MAAVTLKARTLLFLFGVVKVSGPALQQTLVLLNGIITGLDRYTETLTNLVWVVRRIKQETVLSRFTWSTLIIVMLPRRVAPTVRLTFTPVVIRLVVPLVRKTVEYGLALLR